MNERARILIVDDIPAARQTVKFLLMPYDYQLAFATNGLEAVDQADKLMPDLILLDVMMPEMNGFEVCRHLRANPRLAEVPIVMVTALDDRESRLRGLQAGADDFISKPFDRSELRARVQSITRLNRYRRLHTERNKFKKLFDFSPDGILIGDEAGTIHLANPAMQDILGAENKNALIGLSLLSFILPELHAYCKRCLKEVGSNSSSSVQIETELIGMNGVMRAVELHAGYIEWESEPAIQVVVRDIDKRKVAQEQVHSLNQKLIEAYDATLAGWSEVLELRDKETEGHSQRVTRMSLHLAKVMGLKDEELLHIRRGALLHDIGKLAIPDRILLKPGKLTEAEWIIMREHPTYAYNWLKKIEFLHPALDIPYCHHERWDGTGYPRRLKGEEIPLAARIFAVVDIWDALSSDRPYRKAWPSKKVRDYIASLAGTHLDPNVVQAFLELTICPNAKPELNN